MKFTMTKTTLAKIEDIKTGSFVYIKPFAIFADCGAMLEGCKVGIAYNGNYDVNRNYARGESLTAPLYSFDLLATLDKTTLEQIENKIHNALTKHFHREPARKGKGKKSEKFHCTRAQAQAIVEAVLGSL